ncbi:sigma-54 dependent transcriptional regulator [Geobacter sp. AOG1]|uniref:sigma-54-dependent transcriptional regulator n=1 Tax=Geobacter sp. AOG1 TaxID=1566346 RepID=UPI001CC59DD9|nr:sigma-54 dependent transcriptional regulator [Geobacter sp. AOG1]GFE58548.1 acetoacetate metabolism regulatory protein AtoC [Geobacter sp. AOG1]
MRALVIDRADRTRVQLCGFLRDRGYEVVTADTGSGGMRLAKDFSPTVAFVDQQLLDAEGVRLITPLTDQAAGTRVMMMADSVELDKAVHAMKHGAEYYFAKPLDLDQVGMILDGVEALQQSSRETAHAQRLDRRRAHSTPTIGESPQIIRVQRLVKLLAQNPTTPVLIMGESGSGKELVARSIHELSQVSGPLVEINCASLSETLLESELFGHEKGAFTDAKTLKKGLFEIAADGTIFFDELGEMPLAIQAKLLKVLDTQFFRRVGGVNDLKSSARFMAATNRDLPLLVREGKFREDLYYRINVLPIKLPSLRERGRDILLLADYYVRLVGDSMGRSYTRLDPVVEDLLLVYMWPGNVRELRNVIERALILAGSGPIAPEHLPSDIRGLHPVEKSPGETGNLRPLCQVEEEYIRQVLHATNDNHSRTASILGISRSTLLAKLKKISPLS